MYCLMYSRFLSRADIGSFQQRWTRACQYTQHANRRPHLDFSSRNITPCLHNKSIVLPALRHNGHSNLIPHCLYYNYCKMLTLNSYLKMNEHAYYVNTVSQITKKWVSTETMKMPSLFQVFALMSRYHNMYTPDR